MAKMQRILAGLLSWLFVVPVAGDPPSPIHAARLRLSVKTPLTPNTPLDPVLDFPELSRQANLVGVLDPNSITVINTATGQRVPHALTEDFAYSDRGRIEWVVADPGHTEFEIEFRTSAERPPLCPQMFTPQIGTGDLLRYNAAELRPIAIPYAPGLHDLNGDGHPDLTGAWNYAHRPGQPWDGIVCFPHVGDAPTEFGDMVRLRYVAGADAEPQFFSHTYMSGDFADFNQDGRLDLVTTGRGTGQAAFFLNSGRRDPGGLPLFEPAGTAAVTGWQACSAVDLDGDGACDLIVDGEYVQNENPAGWPFKAASPVPLDAGRLPCFLDLDADGRRDAICLQGGESVQPDFYRAAWRRSLGGTPPRFGEEQLLADISLSELSLVTAWQDGNRSGLIVQHAAYEQIAIFELRAPATAAAAPLFERVGRAESESAVLSLSDQAWPCLCDWDDDGDLDLLVGGGYGWPRIVINTGSRARPAFAEPQRILADGQPIRLVRNDLLGEPHNWHDMGYPYPDFVDWDGDGLRDLVCPNETNRIYWFRNIGRRGEPQFGSRQQVLCDGFPDSAARRTQSATRANDPDSNNGVYPYEPEQPFLWRTGAALADFNGDGLTDLITHDGHQRVATLFVQYRDSKGTLRLRRDGPLQLPDGSQINDQIVERRAHWTESFRAVDWNRDGLQDLIYSVAGAHSGTKDGGSIYLLRNVGTLTDPVFATPDTMCCYGEPIRITNHGPHPWPGDFDGDGYPDLIACVEWSVYCYYCHAALTMTQRPTLRLGSCEAVLDASKLR